MAGGRKVALPYDIKLPYDINVPSETDREVLYGTRAYVLPPPGHPPCAQPAVGLADLAEHEMMTSPTPPPCRPRGPVPSFPAALRRR